MSEYGILLIAIIAVIAASGVIFLVLRSMFRYQKCKAWDGDMLSAAGFAVTYFGIATFVSLTVATLAPNGSVISLLGAIISLPLIIFGVRILSSVIQNGY